MIIVSVPFASANGRGSILRLCLQLLPFDFLAERPHDNGDGDGIHAEKGSQFEYQRAAAASEGRLPEEAYDGT